jgi:hypothetical protein
VSTRSADLTTSKFIWNSTSISTEGAKYMCLDVKNFTLAPKWNHLSTFASLSNCPLLCNTTVLKHVVSFVAEAEFGAVFVNAKEGTVTRTALAEMGHNQDATELKTDNTTADGIINKKVQQKRSKAMGMILYWVKYRVAQG